MASKLSVLIAARNETYLEKTIRNILENAEGDIEVIVELDGYLPDPQIVLNDDRVIFYHHETSIGQRQCINHAAKVAKGDFIMKLDAHCAVDKGFDVKLAADCEKDWTVIPRMYNLDIATWTPKLHKRTDYMYIRRDPGDILRSEYYGSRQPKNDKLIDDIMTTMGPGWFIRKDRFFELGCLDENHGSWGQMGIELACKAWLSGGRMVVNKKTWFAHWFRGGGGPGFPYPISGRDQEKARKYSSDLWLNNKWDKQIRPFQWMLDKFNPPGWEKEVVKPKETVTKEIEKLRRMIRKEFRVLVRHDFSPIGSHTGDRIKLIKLWKEAGYKEGAEIGVQRGIYSNEILTGIPGVKLHCIDPWGVYKDSHLTQNGQDRNYQITLKKLDPFIKSGHAVIHRDYSQNIHDEFKDGSLDFLYIDGLHTFDACALDLIYWCPKVRVGGMIGVHDYLAMRRGGVIEAVDAYTRCHMIHPWFVTREVLPTAFWIVEK